jgi:hypothetical protein
MTEKNGKLEHETIIAKNSIETMRKDNATISKKCYLHWNARHIHWMSTPSPVQVQVLNSGTLRK